MIGDVKSVELAEDGKCRAGLAGVDIGIEAGDIACLIEGISQGLIFFCQISVGFPFGIACLGMGPKPSLGVEDELLMGIDVLYDELLPVCHVDHPFEYYLCFLCVNVLFQLFTQ